VRGIKRDMDWEAIQGWIEGQRESEGERGEGGRER